MYFILEGRAAKDFHIGNEVLHGYLKELMKISDLPQNHIAEHTSGMSRALITGFQATAFLDQLSRKNNIPEHLLHEMREKYYPSWLSKPVSIKDVLLPVVRNFNLPYSEAKIRE